MKKVFSFLGRLSGNRKTSDPPVTAITADPAIAKPITHKKP
jgi:hypothetical protein